MKLFNFFKNLFKYERNKNMMYFFGEELNDKYKDRLIKLEELREIDAGIEKLQAMLFSN